MRTSEPVVEIPERAVRERPRLRVLYVYNSGDLRNEFRERRCLGGPFVAGCGGRIRFRRKGQEVLVEALSRLRTKGESKLLIVGAVHPDMDLLVFSSVQPERLGIVLQKGWTRSFALWTAGLMKRARGTRLDGGIVPRVLGFAQ